MFEDIFSVRYRLFQSHTPASVPEFRRAARRALPRMVWSYVDSGAEDLVTLNANRGAFQRWSLRQRVLSGAYPRDLRTQVAGITLDLPVILAPTGATGLTHWTGELGAARAAEAAGTRAVLSTAASYTPEEVARGTTADHFFQLYPWTDDSGDSRALSQSIINRVRASGFHALFLTVDVPVPGNREVEKRRGLTLPPVLTPARMLNAALRPRWWVPFVRHRRFGSRLLFHEGDSAVASTERTFNLLRPDLSWDDLAWVRERWDGPLYIKGILDPDDAERAVDLGAEGVVVSNHGGRQLDGAIASLDALPGIAARVGDRAQVLLDGGIRRGADVVKALCLGADAVLIGRAYLYGLAARGPAGVTGVLEILRAEMTRTMTMMGVGSVAELGPGHLLPAETVVDKVPDDRSW
jgi:L-lactate dehydrogenase (cytochrome)/(S)-mandelate dehydrogenase